MSDTSRRTFLGAAASVAGSMSLGTTGAAPASAAGEIARRPFGRHRDSISAIGLGGHHLGDAGSSAEATRIVHEAIDSGITFFDNAWEYNDHRSEDWLGAGLRGGYRDKIFLMTKVCTHGRDASLAMQMLDESLRRLGTDHLDLWQAHAITYDNDPELAYREDGLLEAFDKAKQMGKVRYVGFTGHKDPGLHMKMISGGYAFDSVQMPLNAFDAQFRSFAKLVLPEANRRGIAVLGMKPFQGTGLPFTDPTLAYTPEDALRYAMSLPVTTTICGIDSIEVLRQNVGIAKRFVPMTPGEMAGLERRVAGVSGDGRYEVYKTSLAYDNIVTREVHGMPVDGAHP